ncbi:MAG: serine hydrolase [Aureispira sp.]|nr:serine hydrolase [Aureispira sp.]
MSRLGLGTIILILFGFLMCQSDIPDQPIVTKEEKRLFDSVMQARQLAEENRQKEEAWVNEQFSKLDEDGRLGQLFMIGAYPSQGEADKKSVLAEIEKQQVGGIIFFKGRPTYTAHLTNVYQAKSKIPLMMSMDAEWGISMRVDSTVKYPRQLLMGAIQDNSLLYEFGKETARQCRRIGIHINFAPVVDVNNNPNNPVIGDRSFGEDRENVTAKAYQYIKGMQDHGVMACAKHFPGHGDTDVDSHKDLPIINHNLKRLDSIELYPFRNLIQQKVQSIMVAHLNIPALDTTANTPITLSPKAVQGLLKDSMGFEGLIFTDALNMHGVTKYFEDGETDLKALLAGNDVLLVTQNIPVAKTKIKEAIANNQITWEEINSRVKKILHAKYKMGLNDYKPVDLKGIVDDLNTEHAEQLNEQIIAKSLTLVHNKDNLVPLRHIRNRRIATISFGSGKKTTFQRALSRYGITNHQVAGHSITSKTSKNLMRLKNREVVIVSLHRLGRLAKNDFKLSASVRTLIQNLSKETKVILVAFGMPYSIKYFENTWAVAAYNDRKLTQQLAAQALCGGLPFEGRLPVSASEKFKCGMGENTDMFKMPYAGSPEEVGMSSKTLRKIDAIAKEMINVKAAPGCQVLVAKNGKIAFHKAYGHHTYDKKRAVRLTDIYDVASVTKVAATTISIMKLYEQGKLDLDKKMSDYLPILKGTNKEYMVIKDILAHKAGLKPWIPFYTRTLDSIKQPMWDRYYKKTPDSKYCVRIADSLYFCAPSMDTVVWQRIFSVPQRPKKNYRYSDLGFYLFTNMIKNVAKKPLDKFAAENFYNPMGLEYTMFNPMDNGIPRSHIVPTEKDEYFRYQVVHGDVHDMGAAMIGGVSGHAGLFTQAPELATIFQMLINGGIFGNRRYLKEETINKFTAQVKADSRRGLGFDRKEKSDKAKNSINVAYQASDKTFGHTGFTGIGAWADPENDLIYIFFSNRTYPSGENMMLIKKSIRTRIQEVIYESIKKK